MAGSWVERGEGERGEKEKQGEKENKETKQAFQWNTLDLYCLGGTAIHMINGKVNMVLLNSRHIRDGVETPLTKGKIQIQSEGAEIYYREMTITPITQIPEAILMAK